jgi:hypothetical protein
MILWNRGRHKFDRVIILLWSFQHFWMQNWNPGEDQDNYRFYSITQQELMPGSLPLRQRGEQDRFVGVSRRHKLRSGAFNSVLLLHSSQHRWLRKSCPSPEWEPGLAGTKLSVLLTSQCCTAEATRLAQNQQQFPILQGLRRRDPLASPSSVEGMQKTYMVG